MYNERNSEEYQIVCAIFRNIARGDDPRGGFLTYFAKAMCQADLQNQELLMPVAKELVKKYNLEQTQRDRCILTASQYEAI